jgi:protein-S-isoprenylcysteine O-methyltransferase Ste14
MSNDPYEDLSAEEKAILKREMKFRIEQQKSREKAQAQMPQIFIASAVLCIAIAAFFAVVTRAPWDENGFNEDMFIPILIPSAGMVLIGVGLWLWRQYKGSNDKNVNGGSSKNKRG